MRLNRREFVGLAGAAAVSSAVPARAGASGVSFAPELDSLKAYRAPDWFRDAKLGFWACWGPEAVPEMGDWYARNMYIQDHPQYEDHLARYGHPSKFGYKDLVPLWRGENWNPDRLMGLYKKAGAKYFCAIAQHHDNIDCWNSRSIVGTPSRWAPGAMSSESGAMRPANMACASESRNTLAPVGIGLE